MTRFVILFTAVFAISLAATSAEAQDAGKLKGYMFGDYYYVAANHDEDIEGLSGMQFRRIYLTYDRGLSEQFSIRLRLEMNSAGDFKTKTKMEPVVKDAYLRWSKNGHNIYFGISPTPTWNVTEAVWGYRSVEKTVIDLQKFGSSRDFGISFQGAFDDNEKLSYHVMLGNGNSNSSEVGQGKKILTSLTLRPGRDFVFEGYFDTDDAPGGKRSITVQGFAGYDGENGRAGVQYVRQWRRANSGADDDALDLVSFWGAKKLTDNVWGFARYDRAIDPNPDGAKIDYIPFDPTAKSNFVLAGLDFTPVKDVHFMPNVEAVFYDENNAGTSPDMDFIPRLTMYYKF